MIDASSPELAAIRALAERLEILLDRLTGAISAREANLYGRRAVTLERLAKVRAAFPSRAFTARDVAALFPTSLPCAQQWLCTQARAGMLARTDRRGLYRIVPVAEVQP